MLSLEGNEEYRSFMDRLAQSNVDQYVNLPMIAVMGDTSSGKSSLLSMISTIELPKSEKLTTRCPIMLQMRRSDEMIAKISIHWKDNCSSIDANRYEAKTVDESNWHEITNFITDAQDHIIETTGKEVARDIVSVDMRGPHCEDLTLIDLPGIVRSIGRGESTSLSQDIQSLLEDYLKNDRCVILAVLPANVDFHNSQILALAREVDPGTVRTIPVLTKPDIIDSGAEDSVKELLLGLKTEKFEKGFHMVKGRGQDALKNKVSIVEALEQEETFFRTREPWKSLSGKDLFGTKSLRVKLGDLQMRLVRDSFPSIVSEMKERLKIAEDAMLLLGHVPVSPQERRNAFLQIKDDLVKKSEHHAWKNNGKQKRITAEFHAASSEFRDAIQSSQLARISDVLAGTKVLYQSNGVEIATEVYYVEEDVGLVYVPVADESPVTTDDPVGATTKDEHGKVATIVRGDGLAHKVKGIHIEKVRRDPHWLMKLIQDNRSLNLPIFLDSDVFDLVVRQLVEDEWEGPCEELVEKVTVLLAEAVEGLIKACTAVQIYPSLQHFLHLIAKETLESMKQEAKSDLEGLLNGEKIQPYTQNDDLFNNISKLRFKRVKNALLDVAHSLPDNIEKSYGLQLLTQAFEYHESLSMEIHMAEDMLNALNAYGKVAMKRFIDVVPMICMGILMDFSKRFNEALLEVDESDVERLMQVSSESMTTYNNLAKEVETLRAGLNCLRIL